MADKWDYVRAIPLFGGLVDCTWDDHWESLGQIFVVLALSTTPIWLGALIVYSFGSNLDYSSFKAALQSSVEHGELFMYATAILAPVFWMAQVDPPGAHVFPSKVSHMLLIGIIDLVAAAFFGLITAHSSLNPVFVSRASKVIFAISIGLLYLGTVYHTSRLNVPEEFKRQEKDFSAAFEEHRQ